MFFNIMFVIQLTVQPPLQVVQHCVCCFSKSCKIHLGLHYLYKTFKMLQKRLINVCRSGIVPAVRWQLLPPLHTCTSHWAAPILKTRFQPVNAGLGDVILVTLNPTFVKFPLVLCCDTLWFCSYVSQIFPIQCDIVLPIITILIISICFFILIIPITAIHSLKCVHTWGWNGRKMLESLKSHPLTSAIMLNKL